MPIDSTSITELLAGLIAWPVDYPVKITGISGDNRKVVSGDLFLACNGPTSQRDAFIEDAIKRGAVAILKEANHDTASFETKTIANHIIPICTVSKDKLKAIVGHIAARFFGDPCQDLTMIGVTGTNGKTSCTQFIAQVLNNTNALQKCGVIGTLGYGFPDQLTASTLTTPDPIDLQSMLSRLKKQDATHVAMEVSSHSLIQHRVTAIPFEVAVLTNLTRDHLDYHETMENYAQAKRLLFLTPGLKKAILNIDDEFGQTLFNEFYSALDCYTYTITPNTNFSSAKQTTTPKPTVWIEDLTLHPKGFSANIASIWGNGELHSTLLGRFNVSNLMAVLTTLCALGFSFKQVLTSLSALSNVPGRMQQFGGKNSPLVIIDYAHTPDALEKALSALREHSDKKIWCIFGCGGNRDKGKRPQMARIAESYSDHVVVTDDNPRFEYPQSIVTEIRQGFKHPSAVQVIHDRAKAITQTIQLANIGDIVLVAGKGHETYQQIGDIQIPFSDTDVVKKALMQSWHSALI